MAEVLNEFFTNSARSLNISIPDDYICEQPVISEDPIDNILTKFANHPSIKMINEKLVKGNFTFTTVSVTEVEREIKALDTSKVSMSNSIPSKVIKQNCDILFAKQ